MSGESHTGHSAPSLADGSQPSASTSDSPTVITKKSRAHAMPARGHIVDLTEADVELSSTSEEEQARPTAERKNIQKLTRKERKWGSIRGSRDQRPEG